MKNEIGTLVNDETSLLTIICELKPKEEISNDLIASFERGRRFLSIFDGKLILFSSNFNFNLVSNLEFIEHMSNNISRVVSSIGINREIYYTDNSGKRQGSYKAYNKHTSDLVESSNYVDGKLHGESVKYSYQTIIKENYVNGVLHGNKVTTDKNGTIHNELIYENGLLHGLGKYYLNGKLSYGHIFENGVSKEKIEFNEDGTIYVKYTIEMFLEEFLT